MRNCMMNAISLGCIAVGSFFLGSSFGLALSKDESDIFDENCIKLNDVNVEEETDQSRESYERMVNYIYGSDSSKISPQERRMILDTIHSTYGLISKNNLEDPSLEPDEEPEIDDDEIQRADSFDIEIISEDDFYYSSQSVEYGQENLIYYAKDDVLTDERDQVIYDVENIVGSEALTSFGSMTLDKDTVFVRNNRLKLEYEVTRDDGSYQEVVLGYSDEDEDRAYQRARQYFEKLNEQEKE